MGRSREAMRRSRGLTTCKKGCLGCLDYKHVQQDATGESEDDDCPKKQRLIEDIYRSDASMHGNCKLKGNRYDDLECEICKQGDGEAEMLICDGCDKGFHMYCLCPILIKIPRGKWFCPHCSNKDRVADFPLIQTKIVDFFRIQKPLPSSGDLVNLEKTLTGYDFDKN